MSNPYNVQESYIALATLDATDVCPMEIRLVRKALLRQANSLSEETDAPPKAGQRFMIIHSGYTARVETMGLQTMSSDRFGASKSFLKWAGGKTRYADQIVALAPNFTGRYIEPFMGSAAVFFELGVAKSRITDANEELVVCFQQVASAPETIMALLDKMPNNREFYNTIRSQDVAELSLDERAARVIYLNKTSFRGLWRVNKNGKFNVPYGEYDRPYYNSKTLRAASLALRAAEIEHCDFEKSIEGAQPGDWVYLDPPYIPLGGFSDFKRYTSGQFGEDDHFRLARLMREADRRGVFVTLSNSDTPTTREIFKEFRVVPMVTRRDINLNSKSRGSSDLVFTNYDFREEEYSLF